MTLGSLRLSPCVSIMSVLSYTEQHSLGCILCRVHVCTHQQRKDVPADLLLLFLLLPQGPRDHQVRNRSLKSPPCITTLKSPPCYMIHSQITKNGPYNPNTSLGVTLNIHRVAGNPVDFNQIHLRKSAGNR